MPSRGNLKRRIAVAEAADGAFNEMFDVQLETGAAACADFRFPMTIVEVDFGDAAQAPLRQRRHDGGQRLGVSRGRVSKDDLRWRR